MSRLLKPLIVIGLLAGVAVALYRLAPSQSDPLTPIQDAIERRDFPTARKQLDDHLGRHPRDANALLLAARTARRDDDLIAAKQYLQRYVDVAGETQDGGLERGLAAVQQGDVANANALFGFCLEQPGHPAVPFILEALARGFSITGELDGAVISLDHLLKLPLSTANHCQALVWRGEALEQIDLRPEARKDYEKAIELMPGHIEARLRLASYLSSEEPLAGLTLLMALQQEPSIRHQVKLAQARCHRCLGEHATAEAIIATLRSERPDDVTVLIEAGILAIDRGRLADAETLLKRATLLDPLNRLANAQLARCLRELGKMEESAMVWRKVKEMDQKRSKYLEQMRRRS